MPLHRSQDAMISIAGGAFSVIFGDQSAFMKGKEN